MFIHFPHWMMLNGYNWGIPHFQTDPCILMFTGIPGFRSLAVLLVSLCDWFNGPGSMTVVFLAGNLVLKWNQKKYRTYPLLIWHSYPKWHIEDSWWFTYWTVASSTLQIPRQQVPCQMSPVGPTYIGLDSRKRCCHLRNPCGSPNSQVVNPIFGQFFGKHGVQDKYIHVCTYITG